MTLHGISLTSLWDPSSIQSAGRTRLSNDCISWPQRSNEYLEYPHVQQKIHLHSCGYSICEISSVYILNRKYPHGKGCKGKLLAFMDSFLVGLVLYYGVFQLKKRVVPEIYLYKVPHDKRCFFAIKKDAVHNPSPLNQGCSIHQVTSSG